MSENIVILANSRKLCGRCVAGKKSDGTWIRLTKVGGAPIPISEASKYRMLSFIEVEGLLNRPSQEYNYHTENSIYRNAIMGSNLRGLTIDGLLDHPDDIFGTGRCINEDEAQELNQSLLFVEVENLCISKEAGGNYRDKLRGSFVYNGNMYTDISVTDSVFEQRFSIRRSPYYETFPDAYITISLGEPFKGYAYKLISGIYIPE